MDVKMLVNPEDLLRPSGHSENNGSQHQQQSEVIWESVLTPGTQRASKADSLRVGSMHLYFEKPPTMGFLCVADVQVCTL